MVVDRTLDTPDLLTGIGRASACEFGRLDRNVGPGQRRVMRYSLMGHGRQGSALREVLQASGLRSGALPFSGRYRALGRGLPPSQSIGSGTGENGRV